MARLTSYRSGTDLTTNKETRDRQETDVKKYCNFSWNFLFILHILSR